MKDELKRKLNQALAHPIVTEERVVYTLVEIRKLMDRNNLDRDDHKPIWFFCDWVAHISLDRKKGWQTKLLNFADSVVERNVSWDDLTDTEKEFMTDTFSLESVRQHLISWLKDQRVLPLTLAYPNGWYWFVRKYADVVSDSPLVLKGGKVVKEVTLKIVEGNAGGTRLDLEWTFVRQGSSKFQWCMPMMFRKEEFSFGRNGARYEKEFDDELKALGFAMPWDREDFGKPKGSSTSSTE
jgi:hypothetical protein